MRINYTCSPIFVSFRFQTIPFKAFSHHCHAVVRHKLFAVCTEMSVAWGAYAQVCKCACALCTRSIGCGCRWYKIPTPRLLPVKSSRENVYVIASHCTRCDANDDMNEFDWYTRYEQCMYVCAVRAGYGCCIVYRKHGYPAPIKHLIFECQNFHFTGDNGI